MIILTSGTTGRPKGAARGASAGALPAVAAVLERIPLRPRDTQVVAAPLFHAWGLSHLMFGITRCATTVVAPRFDAEATLRSIAEHHARVLVAVPVMLRRILALDRAGGRRGGHVDACRSSPSAVRRSAAQLATGLAERFGPVALQHLRLHRGRRRQHRHARRPAPRHPTTVGRVADSVRVEILDADGRAVPAGASGRIFVGNGARFEGYTDGGTRSSSTACCRRATWATSTPTGYLFVDGRDDDMIVSGGENLFPSEVEELLNHHPKIHEAAVVGVARRRVRPGAGRVRRASSPGCG